MDSVPDKIAIWVITPNGLNLAARLNRQWPEAAIFCSQRLSGKARAISARLFDRLAPAVRGAFNQFDSHIFVMAAGIVVRVIASLLHSKSKDPAVIVVDDQSKFAISLVSGHIGGANQLAAQVAGLLNATPVITTATDVNHRPAIDVLAKACGLNIENPEAIKAVNMSLLLGEEISIHDPYEYLEHGWTEQVRPNSISPDIFIDDTVDPFSHDVLVLRPPSLVAGIGCNRGTTKEEIDEFLHSVLADYGLSMSSLDCIASIDLKKDEAGLLNTAAALGVPIYFYSQEALNEIRHVPNPSHMVAKHVGVQSVCEAAAILAAKQGNLIVPKQKTANVTVAIARHSSLSWVSDREA